MFVQCAVLADPERLAKEPLILVGGSPSGRGVVTSASYGCRAFGVRSAMPTATALRLCPAAIVVKVPGDMIRRKSGELASALQRWTPIAAMASVDEAYLDLSGTEQLYHHAALKDTALRIQASIKSDVGLDVSIGGGTNRLIAKLATSSAKPAGVHIVPPGGEEDFVATLRIEDLIGVGPSLVAALRRRGIGTMAGLRALDLETLGGWWGPERARWLWRRCRGLDDSPVVIGRGTKSVSSETTFHEDIDDLRELERALLGQVVDAAASLRRKGLYARTVTVKLRDSDFRDRSRSRTVTQAVQTDRAIYSVARTLLRDLRGGRSTPARLIGVGLTNLTANPEPAQHTMIGLVPPIEDDRDRTVAQAVDSIRRKHGRVIGPGSVARNRKRGDTDDR